MTVTLRPLRPEELDGRYRDQRRWYAADLAEKGGMTPEAALAKAARARSRYRSPGFAEVAVSMGKDLA